MNQDNLFNLKHASNWDSDFRSTSKIFSHLSVPEVVRSSDGWPDHSAMNLAAKELSIRNLSGTQVAFVAQPPKGRRRAAAAVSIPGYEKRIFKYGEVQTRLKHWHDYFNMLVWLNFPKSKAILNSLHNRQMERTDEAAVTAWSAGRRTLPQDALSLFDEGGILIFCRETIESDVVRRIKNLGLHGVKSAGSFTDLGPVEFRVFGHALFEEIIRRGDDNLAEVRGLAFVVGVPEHNLNISDINQSSGVHDRALAMTLAQDDSLVHPSAYQTISLNAVN